MPKRRKNRQQPAAEGMLKCKLPRRSELRGTISSPVRARERRLRGRWLVRMARPRRVEEEEEEVPRRKWKWKRTMLWRAEEEGEGSSLLLLLLLLRGGTRATRARTKRTRRRPKRC